VANEDDERDDAPPAIPHREPGDLARRIAHGHAHLEHFPDLDAADLARLIQDALDRGESKAFGGRAMYWDEEERIVVIVNAADPDGGTAVRTDRRYFDAWGEQQR
jgi:hypothetical protein